MKQFNTTELATSHYDSENTLDIGADSTQNNVVSDTDNTRLPPGAEELAHGSGQDKVAIN